MRGVYVGESGRQLHVIGQRLLDPAREIGDARVLKRGIYVSASGGGSGAAELRPAKLIHAQGRGIGIEIGKADVPVFGKRATADAVGEVASSRGRQENPHSQSVIKTPRSADNGWILALSHIPGHADARAPLIEVTGNALRYGGLARSCALAHQDGGSPQRSLRLRVPGAIPTKAVCDGKVSRHLPFVLPVKAEVGLVIGEKGCGWTQER